MTRDPRLDPHTGDVLERGLGIEWRVLHAGPATVDYEVLGTDEPRRSISLSHWKRQPFSDRDVKPHNALVMHYPGSSGKVLDTLNSQCDPIAQDGDVAPLPRRDFLKASGLERGAWLRGVDALRAMGLVETTTERCGRVSELRYTLTSAGLANAAHRLASASQRAGGESVSEPVRAGERATLGSGLIALVSQEKGTEKKEETPCSCHHDRAGGEPVEPNTEPGSEPVGKLEALLALVAPGLVDAVEGYLRAKTAELLREAEAKTISPPPTEPTHCGCGKALEESTRNRDKVKFMRCPDWRTCTHWNARGKGKDVTAAPNLGPSTAEVVRAHEAAKAQREREDAEGKPSELDSVQPGRFARAAPVAATRRGGVQRVSVADVVGGRAAIREASAAPLATPLA